MKGPTILLEVTSIANIIILLRARVKNISYFIHCNLTDSEDTNSQFSATFFSCAPSFISRQCHPLIFKPIRSPQGVLHAILCNRLLLRIRGANEYLTMTNVGRSFTLDIFSYASGSLPQTGADGDRAVESGWEHGWANQHHDIRLEAVVDGGRIAPR